MVQPLILRAGHRIRHLSERIGSGEPAIIYLMLTLY